MGLKKRWTKRWYSLTIIEQHSLMSCVEVLLCYFKNSLIRRDVAQKYIRFVKQFALELLIFRYLNATDKGYSEKWLAGWFVGWERALTFDISNQNGISTFFLSLLRETNLLTRVFRALINTHESTLHFVMLLLDSWISRRAQLSRWDYISFKSRSSK